MQGFTSQEIEALKPGDLVRFGQTTGDYVSNWLEGVVMAVGESADFCDSRIMPGAIVAWHDQRPHPGYDPNWVNFTPFWNQRFQPVR